MKPSQDVIDAQLKLAIERYYKFVYDTGFTDPRMNKAKWSKVLTKIWFTTNDPTFNYCTPISYIQNGQGQKVLNHIEDLHVKFIIP